VRADSIPAGTGRRAISQILLYGSVKFEAVSEPVSIVLEEGRGGFPLDQPEVFFRVAAPDAPVGFVCIICRVEGELRMPSAVGFQPIFASSPSAARRHRSPASHCSSPFG
jgi:hypothetical protein